MSSALSTSKSKCGTYTRQAWEAGGIKTIGSAWSAKDFGPILIATGFYEINISAEQAVKGDIIVIQAIVGEPRSSKDHPDGHTAMYSGSEWISDFKQRDHWAGGNYRKVQPSYKTYRWGGKTKASN